MRTTNEAALVPEAPPAWQAQLETLALAAAVIAVGTLLDRRDPFLLRRGFSWLSLAPLLTGLRYGAVAGMACAALQALSLAVAWRWGLVSLPGSVQEAVLGWFVAGLVAGEFRNAWARRGWRLQALADDLRLRQAGLSRAYHALRASHDRLERGAPGRPPTLRGALEAFRREMLERIDGGPRGAGDRILGLFSSQGFVRAATLHWVDGDGRPGPAAASLGVARSAEDDPLVRQAIRLGEVVSLREPSERSLALAAVPLVDVQGRVHGVVAIRDMPFVALHTDTLELLAVLGGLVADRLSQAPAPELAAPRFLRSVSRARVDARRHGVPACLVMVHLGSAPGQVSAGRLLAARIAAQRRLTDDATVLLDSGGKPAVAVLLRLADADGLKGYRERLERFVRDELGALEISVRAWPLGGSTVPSWPSELRPYPVALADGSAPRDAGEEMEEASCRPGAA